MLAWILRKHHLIAPALLLVLTCPLLLIARYDYPNGDDYLTFFHAQTLVPFGATRWWYLNWTGRYTSFFLQSLSSHQDTWLAVYKVIPIALLLFGFASLFSFLRAFLGPALYWRDLLSLASFVYVVLISLTPDIATAFYWQSTNMQYAGAVFLTLCIFALHIKLEETTARPTRAALWVLLIVSIILLSGLNEISILLFIGILALVTCHQFIRRRRLPMVTLSALAISIAFGLVSLLAPGNTVRASKLHIASHAADTLLRAGRSSLDLSIELLTATLLLPASVLYLSFLQVKRDRLAHVSALLAGVRWHWVLLVSYALVTLVTFAVFEKIGMQAPVARVKNVYVYSVVLGWFFLVTVVFVNLTAARHLVRVPRWVVGLSIAAVAAFAVTGFALRLDGGAGDASTGGPSEALATIGTQSVYTNAYLDLLSGRAARYAAHNEGTTRRLRAAHGECVEFAPLTEVPRTIVIDFVKYPWSWCPMKYATLYGRAYP